MKELCFHKWQSWFDMSTMEEVSRCLKCGKEHRYPRSTTPHAGGTDA